jgi:hypothetical protein
MSNASGGVPTPYDLLARHRDAWPHEANEALSVHDHLRMPQ